MQADAVHGEQVALEGCHHADAGPRPRNRLLLLALQLRNSESLRIKGDSVVIIGWLWWNASRLFASESFNSCARFFQCQPISARNIPSQIGDVWHDDENRQEAEEQNFWEVRTNHIDSFASEPLCRGIVRILNGEIQSLPADPFRSICILSQIHHAAWAVQPARMGPMHRSVRGRVFHVLSYSSLPLSESHCGPQVLEPHATPLRCVETVECWSVGPPEI